MKRFIVKVDDNYHYMDPEYRSTHGTFATSEEAIAACKRIVDESIYYKPGASAGGMFLWYTLFGEDPFIVVEDNEPGVRETVTFSGWTYAREKCEELARIAPSKELGTASSSDR